MKMKNLVLLVGLFASTAFASPMTVDQIYCPASGCEIISQGTDDSKALTETNTKTVSNKTFDGTDNVQKQCMSIYDFAVSGASTMVALNCSFPANAVITNAWLDVKTALAATGTQAGFGIGLAGLPPTSADLTGIVQMSSYTAGLYQLVPHGTTATMFKLTAATTGYFKFSTPGGTNPTPTAGKATVFIDYLISQ